ncbi:hypothetical protein [Clostridium sp. 1xD42-85]|nr:hypothetical protein [Clostridium sp. 1xD42-85]
MLAFESAFIPAQAINASPLYKKGTKAQGRTFSNVANGTHQLKF